MQHNRDLPFFFHRYAFKFVDIAGRHHHVCDIAFDLCSRGSAVCDFRIRYAGRLRILVKIRSPILRCMTPSETSFVHAAMNMAP